MWGYGMFCCLGSDDLRVRFFGVCWVEYIIWFGFNGFFGGGLVVVV